MLESMFQLGVPVLEKVIRTILVYFALMIGLRLAGKRELAQLNAMDLIVLLMLSNTVQNAIIGEDNTVVGGLLGAATLLFTNYLIVRFLYGHERIDRIVEGQPDVLIENGELQEVNLKRELLTRGELEIAAHRQGFASLEEIEKAVLETGGGISFTAKKPPLDMLRHNELTARLDEVVREMGAIKTALVARG